MYLFSNINQLLIDASIRSIAKEITEDFCAINYDVLNNLFVISRHSLEQ